jgi:lipoyl(octanoyl) transferase
MSSLPSNPKPGLELGLEPGLEPDLEPGCESGFRPRRCCWVEHYDQIPYQTAWEWQKQLVAARRAQLASKYLATQDAIANGTTPQRELHQEPDSPEPDSPEPDSRLEDRLILLEHPPVYTLGQGASLDFLKFDPAQAPGLLYRTERGGEVTYHCPGQLVGYPILDLRHYRQDLHWYLRQLEEVLIRVLAQYDLTGERIAGLTGVWVEGRKLAAIGIKVSRWITMHGFALNVCPDLTGFAQIVPCGIANRPVGSMAEFVPDVSLAEVRMQVVDCFAEVFGVEICPSP